MPAFRRIFFAAAVALTAFAPARTASAQSAPLAIPARQFDEASGACRDARVAAVGREKLAVGWTVPDGPGEGVYVRWRIDYLIEPTMRIASDATTAARDLAMAFDAAGRLHLVWTSQGRQSRELHYARLDEPGQPPALTRNFSEPTTATADQGNVDFPALAASGDGGMLIAWQQARGVRYSIRALKLSPDGIAADLGAVSGESDSGLNPQILATDPIRIAWYEIDELASNVRVNEWHADERRWRPSALEALARQFDAFGQVQFYAGAAGDGLLGCWRQFDGSGGSTIAVGRAQAAAAAGSDRQPKVEVFASPGGDPAAPCLSGGDRPKLAWQNFSESGQSIQIAGTGDAAGVRPKPLTISPAGQRFAALPDQATIGNWSAIVWIDDARDGGSGGLYLAEVTWPAAN